MEDVDVCSVGNSPVKLLQPTEKQTISFDVAPVDFTEMLQSNQRQKEETASVDMKNDLTLNMNEWQSFMKNETEVITTTNKIDDEPASALTLNDTNTNGHLSDMMNGNEMTPFTLNDQQQQITTSATALTPANSSSNHNSTAALRSDLLDCGDQSSGSNSPYGRHDLQWTFMGSTSQRGVLNLLKQGRLMSAFEAKLKKTNALPK
ncbi:hypothetical protein BDF19DRAFT_414237 [Syncephalis fuscata]|nr:hypothetical protein BDF19DRAFT_414237 [Syncephalis fuscata]